MPNASSGVIVAGWLTVEPSSRDQYLESCRSAIAAARETPGCLDFSLAADSLDPARINVFERWESIDALEHFRGSGPSDDQNLAITSASVAQYEVVSSGP